MCSSYTQAEVTELREAVTMEAGVLTCLSSEDATAAAVKRALPEEPRWQQAKKIFF
jgi:hypothetical protein